MFPEDSTYNDFAHLEQNFVGVGWRMQVQDVCTGCGLKLCTHGSLSHLLQT